MFSASTQSLTLPLCLNWLPQAHPAVAMNSPFRYMTRSTAPAALRQPFDPS
jgi:hypothetical protein